MIAVAIVALLAAIAAPGFLRARKRSQASRVLSDLRILDSAIAQYSMEYQRVKGSTVTIKNLKIYLKKGGQLYTKGTDVLGNKYGPNFKVGTLPKVPTNTRKALSDVANAAYWSPYP